MARTTRLTSIVGKKNSGKTSLIVALAKTFHRKGTRVATLKHGSHPANVDIEGTDTWRHFNEGFAERVLIATPEGRIYFERCQEEPDPVALARHFMGDVDLVIAEGFTSSDLPKIEVFRPSVHEKLRFSPELPNAHCWKAVLTDAKECDVPCPVFQFSDTSWIVGVAAVAWSTAVEV